MSDLQYTLGIDSRDGEQSLSRTGKAAQGLGGILAGLGAAAFAGSFLQRGFQFNQTMRDSEAAIGKVISQFQGLNDEAAKGEASKAMQQLIALEPKAAGSLSTLVDGFLSTLASSQAAGLSVQQNIDLVGRFANAMANANIPTEQLGQEMRSIVTGNIGADSSLARILGITNEMVAAARESGNTYEFLVSKIGKLGEAGDTAAVAFSSLQSATDKAAGALAQGLFDVALDGSKSLTAELEANIEAFVTLGRAIGAAATELVKFGGFVSEALGQASRLAAITTMMLQDGLSYGEAADAVDAVTAAREAETAAAKAQAEAAKKAAAAAIPAKPGDFSAAPKASGGSGNQHAFYDKLIDKQTALNDLKADAANDELSDAERVVKLRQEVADAVKEENRLKNDVGPNPMVILDAEKKRVELQRELLALTKQQGKEAEDNAKKAADRAEQQRKQAGDLAKSRNEFMGELAHLKALASGRKKAADEIERELRMLRDKDRLIELGMSKEKAAQLARQKADLQDKADGKRSKIRGVQTADEGGPLSKGGPLVSGDRRLSRGGPLTRGGGVDGFRRRQQTTLEGDIWRGTAGGSIDQLLANQGPRLQGISPPDIAGRAAGLTAGTAPKPNAVGNAGPSPELAKLDAIHAELVRLRTA